MVLTRSGPLAIVNVPVGDQAVAAAVPAVLITPWKDRTAPELRSGRRQA